MPTEDEQPTPHYNEAGQLVSESLVHKTPNGGVRSAIFYSDEEGKGQIRV